MSSSKLTFSFFLLHQQKFKLLGTGTVIESKKFQLRLILLDICGHTNNIVPSQSSEGSLSKVCFRNRLTLVNCSFSQT
jgi:hypothetical protein